MEVTLSYIYVEMNVVHVDGTCHVHGGQDKSVVIRCELADIDDILVFMYTHLRMVVVLPERNNGTSSWEKDGYYIFEGVIITGRDSCSWGGF